MWSSFKTVLFAAGMAMIAAPAFANNAQSGSCQFADALGDDTDRILLTLKGLAEKWNDSDRAKLEPIFRPQLDKFKFEPGKVYRVAGFAPYMEEYLVVSADFARAQPIFFRLKFGGSESGLVFRNIVFNTEFEEIFEVGTIASPVEVEC